MTHTRTKRRNILIISLIVLILAGALVAAYVFSQETESSSQDAPVTLYLSFLPNVQFAPIYVAVEQGYFAEEGIAISLEHGLNEVDAIDRLAAGDLQFALVSGEQVLLARGREYPIVYVFEYYHRFPVGIASPASLGLTTPEDLRGRVVGVPGLYGASYIGLQALLRAAEMEESDLGELRTIGFTAVENICEERVDAAVIYVVNEPLVIEEECTPVNVIPVSDYATLVSNGLVTNEETIQEQPELVRGMVRAIRRGLEDALADPDMAFQVSVEEYISDLPEDRYAIQRQVLENMLALARSEELGATDPEAWEATQAILLEAGLLEEPLADVPAAYTNRFLPGD